MFVVKQNEQIKLVVSGGQRPRLSVITGPETLVELAVDCISRCWHQNPDERPAFAGIRYTIIILLEKIGFQTVGFQTTKLTAITYSIQQGIFNCLTGAARASPVEIIAPPVCVPNYAQLIVSVMISLLIKLSLNR